MPATMRVVELPAVGSPLRLAERPVREPGPGQALVRVQACGDAHLGNFGFYVGAYALVYAMIGLSVTVVTGSRNPNTCTTSGRSIRSTATGNVGVIPIQR